MVVSTTVYPDDAADSIRLNPCSRERLWVAHGFSHQNQSSSMCASGEEELLGRSSTLLDQDNVVMLIRLLFVSATLLHPC